MSYYIKSLQFFDYRYLNKIKYLSKFILLLIITNHCIGNSSQHISGSIEMNIPNAMLLGRHQNIIVNFKVHELSILKDYILRIKINEQLDNTAQKSSISYMPSNQGKKQTFSSLKEISLDQLIKPHNGKKQYAVNFKLTPGEASSRVKVIFELVSNNQASSMPIAVTWVVNKILLQLKTTDNTHYIVAQSLYGDIENLEEWEIAIIPLHGAGQHNQVTFDVPSLTPSSLANLKNLLPGITKLTESQLYNIKINIPISEQESAFIVVPKHTKNSFFYPERAKGTSSPSALKFMSEHHHSAYIKGLKNGLSYGALGGTLMKLDDQTYTKGQNMGIKIAGAIEITEFVVGIGVAAALIVCCGVPGLIAGSTVVVIAGVLYLAAPMAWDNEPNQ